MATPRTGRPRGRPSGAKNKHTAERERAVAVAAEKIEQALGEGAFEGDAHAYLMSVYKDPAFPIATRVDAAGKALPYEKPRLSSVEMGGPGGGAIPLRIEGGLPED